jgi:hypothetical protein
LGRILAGGRWPQRPDKAACILIFLGKSMAGMGFFWITPGMSRPCGSTDKAPKQVNIAIYGLARKLGCSPFIWRQY